MAGIAVLLPREYMRGQVEKIAQEEKMDLLLVKVIDNSEVLDAARQAISQGAQIIVARGLHALIIKQYTKIPVVEITLTGQELGLLIQKAKKQLNQVCPSIALIGYRNLLSDVTYFNEIFDINLKAYYVDNANEVEGIVREAVSLEPDIVIGGDLVGASMKNYNIPYMFFHSTEDSIRQALQIAQKMAYATDIEKSSHAQFATVVDTMQQGIIKINSQHNITTVNRMAEDLLHKKSNELEGKILEQELKDIDETAVMQVLNGDREMYSTTIRLHGHSLRYIIAPIQYDNKIDGAILSFVRLNQGQMQKESHLRKGYLQGYVANMDFSMMKTTNKSMKASIELAKQYAASEYPVLIKDEMGYNKEKIAQCIHNNSARRSMPFMAVNLSGMDDREQMHMLFGDSQTGDQGITAQCNFGTLFINEIENLSLFCQYQLYRLVRRRPIIYGDEQTIKTLDVRLILGTRKDLKVMVSEGDFRGDFYYAIAGLSLELVPMRSRSKDIEHTIQNLLQAFCTRNICYLTITEGAMKYLCHYSWEGNEIQIENFCERLFLTTTKKVIDESAVKKLLAELYPTVEDYDGKKKVVYYKAPEAVALEKLLGEYRGNRQLVAQALGISTTTLWRRMKKYGITQSELLNGRLDFE